MKKESLIAIAVIGGIILLGIGFYLGLTYAQKQIEKAKTSSPMADLLTSKVIDGFKTNASGKVAEISGYNITINNEGDSLLILIREDAPIHRLVPPEKTAKAPQPTSREDIKIEEIKVGNRANITCQLKADGTLEGTEVVILL